MWLVCTICKDVKKCKKGFNTKFFVKYSLRKVRIDVKNCKSNILNICDDAIPHAQSTCNYRCQSEQFRKNIDPLNRHIFPIKREYERGLLLVKMYRGGLTLWVPRLNKPFFESFERPGKSSRLRAIAWTLLQNSSTNKARIDIFAHAATPMHFRSVKKNLPTVHSVWTLQNMMELNLKIVHRFCDACALTEVADKYLTIIKPTIFYG